MPLYELKKEETGIKQLVKNIFKNKKWTKFKLVHFILSIFVFLFLQVYLFHHFYMP
jgi:hypothetical protein